MQTLRNILGSRWTRRAGRIIGLALAILLIPCFAGKPREEIHDWLNWPRNVFAQGASCAPPLSTLEEFDSRGILIQWGCFNPATGQLSTIPIGTGQGIQYSFTDAGNVFSLFRIQQNPINPLAGTSYATINSFNIVQGALQTGAAYDGIACETDTAGTITSSANGRLAGCEATIAINSSGGSVFDARSLTANGRLNGTNSTNLTNWEGVYSQTFTVSGTGTVSNAYGGVFEDQTAGTVSNLSLWAKGPIQVDKKALFDCSVSGTRCIVISGNSTSNNNELEIVNTAASGHTWDIGEMQAVGAISFRDLTVASGPSFDFSLGSVTNGARNIFSFNASANRTYTYPDGNAAVAIPAALTTTAAPSDNVTVQGMTASGHCTLTATNASAATNIATTFISAKTTNQITVSHTATASMTYDILCTSN